MSRNFTIDPSLSLEALQTRLRTIEAAYGRISRLDHVNAGQPCTVAVVEDGPTPAEQIGLVLAPNGPAAIPAGSSLVCLGVVYVQNVLRPVAAFREEGGAARDRRSAKPDPGAARRRQATDESDWAASMAAMLIRNGPGKAKRGQDAREEPGMVPARKRQAASKGPTADEAKGPAANVAGPRVKAAGATLPALEPREYRVWFGTNRTPVDAANIASGFSSERDTKVHYGHCDVYVPRSHKMGSIGKFHLIRWITGKDDRLKIRRLDGLAADDFWAGIRDQIERAGPGAKDAIVFIHGYRVSFRDAALKAAQIGFDLGIQGAMGFFSWPSRGTLLGYPADERALEGSEAAIAGFLADFARRSGAEAVHVIAHSMGNRGLLRAANRIVADAARRSGCRFGQFILAAADVDADNFRDLAGAYQALAQRTTLYVSSKDLAVQLSRWIGDYPRVGFHPPVTVVEGIDTVSVENVDLTLLGHGYVAEARPVLQDIERLISTNEPPPRFGLEEAKTPDGRRYWTVRA